MATAAKVSQQAISLIERGHLDTLSIRVVRVVFATVDARFEGTVTWRGGQVDRLLDERHARLVGVEARRLAEDGWEVHVEVTFSEFGERGSIDIVALRRDLGIAVIVEVKTTLTAIDDTIRRVDVKDRLAAKLILDRFGWRPTMVSRLLIVLDNSTNRRRVASHDDTLRPAFGTRGRDVRSWLRRPAGRISGLMFLSPTKTNARASSLASEAADVERE